MANQQRNVMASRDHIRVMVVDDEAAVGKTIELILETEGFKVQMFNDATKALEAAKKTVYQLAVVDIKMPQMGGVEFIRRLQEADPNVGTIIMTGYPAIDTARQAMRDGAYDYITKPFRQEEIVEAVERVCREKGLIYGNEDELNTLIGARIRGYRQGLKLTLREVSAKTKLTTSQISQVELGKNAASLWALARISTALKVGLPDLVQDL